MPMANERRRAPRKTFEREAYLRRRWDLPVEPCMIVNISNTGARLAHDAPASLPDRFLLDFTTDGTVHRECTVMWRTRSELGVRFSRGFSPR
jgi:hypothetical protein